MTYQLSPFLTQRPKWKVHARNGKKKRRELKLCIWVKYFLIKILNKCMCDVWMVNDNLFFYSVGDFIQQPEKKKKLNWNELQLFRNDKIWCQHNTKKSHTTKLHLQTKRKENDDASIARHRWFVELIWHSSQPHIVKIASCTVFYLICTSFFFIFYIYSSSLLSFIVNPSGRHFGWFLVFFFLVIFVHHLLFLYLIHV